MASALPPARRPLRVLYVVYWGGAEPLGQSLVLPSVRRLAESVRLSLLTFEKPHHLRQRGEMQRIRSLLDEAGVTWLTLRYHKRPKWPATALDILSGIVRGALHGLRLRPDIVHGRTFVGGLMGLCVARLLRVRFVYHAEGAYGDEQVDAGVWRENGWPHRLARRLEAGLCAQAAAVIVLSERARDRAAESRAPRDSSRLIVVPSTVDVERFAVPAAAQTPGAGASAFVYMGSIGGRYRLESVAAFVACARSVFPSARLMVLTPLEPGRAEATLRASPLPAERWQVASVPHSQVPQVLSGCLAGLHFLRQGLADSHGAPTKLGEYWAAGLPVVVTPQMGDAEEILRRERVGVVVREETEAAFLLAASELRQLLEDGDLAVRCRHVASRHFGLAQACDRQLALYQEVVPSPRAL
jgi:glycosyltransferase involved in cell wall biosynthesis